MAFRTVTSKYAHDKIDFTVDNLVVVRGAYCIICELEKDAWIKVGSLGKARFPRGVYVYVGSAQRGIEQRVGRHRSRKKKLKWHIDHFLEKAEVAAVIAVPSEDKETECGLAKTILKISGASVPMMGFGSSDCKCDSHLVYMGDEDLEPVTETIVYRMSMLSTVYPEKRADSQSLPGSRQ
jgi:sugar fermentation stimulation protein A